MKKVLFSFFLTSMAMASTEYIACHASKEFITTYNFLLDQKELNIKEDQVRKFAIDASKGCSNAAQRFIEIYKLLTKANIDSKNSIEVALKYAKMNDKSAKAFMTIFKEAFLKEYLDLDVKAALTLSNSMIVENEKAVSYIKDDFEKVVKFCKSEQELNLNAKVCSELATEVISSTLKFNAKMSDTFVDSFKYLTDDKGLDLTSFDALTYAKKLSSYGPNSLKNFKEAIDFGVKKKFFAENRKMLIDYACEISMNSSAIKQ